jgi:hypothetical protein
MDLKVELERLKEYYSGSDQEKFQKHYFYVCDQFPDEKEQIDNCLASVIDGSIKRTDDFIEATAAETGVRCV